MSVSSEIISARRENVLMAYNSAKATNNLLFLEKDAMATAEYIFPNQIEDANNIVNLFYKNNRRVVSIQKKTKVGADGLMIEIAKLMTTHNDDKFIVNPANVRILTGMSNTGWEKDIINKAPNCFKDKIFHHGKLKNAKLANLANIHNGLFIVDEVDTGNGENQVLNSKLMEAGLLDIKHMNDHNNRFVFISATMIKELYDLYRWGDLHELYRMTIPESYIGHKDFLEKHIIQEFYSLNSEKNANKWVENDIIDNYGNDYRVHIVRVNNNSSIVQKACIRNGVVFKSHNSKDRLLEDELNDIFNNRLSTHIVIGVKGFFRRANLIPNCWKLCIGAVHENYTTKVDNNVQVQGLTGRMTGYWRSEIEGGHKTGPYRTSIKAIKEYEKIYLDPFGINSYQSAGFNKNNGKISAKSTMLSSKNIPNLEPIELPIVEDKKKTLISKRFKEFQEVKDFWGKMIILYSEYFTGTESGPSEKRNKNKNGFYIFNDKVQSVQDIKNTRSFPLNEDHKQVTHPVYDDVTNKDTLCWIITFYSFDGYIDQHPDRNL